MAYAELIGVCFSGKQPATSYAAAAAAAAATAGFVEGLVLLLQYHVTTALR